MATELEPQAYTEAMQAPDVPQWKLAMDEEMTSLQENSACTLEQQPIGVRPIPAKWVFKCEQDALGNIERYKARLVAKGFMLKEGRTKSVPMSTSIRLVQAEDNQLLDREEYHYSELVGSLLYLSSCTRPDISQAVGCLQGTWQSLAWSTGQQQRQYCGAQLAPRVVASLSDRQTLLWKAAVMLTMLVTQTPGDLPLGLCSS